MSIPEKFKLTHYQKLGSCQWRGGEVGLTVKTLRSLVCLTLEHAALLRE